MLLVCLVWVLLKNMALPNKSVRLCVHPKHKINSLCLILWLAMYCVRTSHLHLSNRTLRPTLNSILSSIKPFPASFQRFVLIQECVLCHIVAFRQSISGEEIMTYQLVLHSLDCKVSSKLPPDNYLLYLKHPHIDEPKWRWCVFR